MQARYTYRKRTPTSRILYPLKYLIYSSLQTVPPLISSHSIILYERSFALHYLPSPANGTTPICGCMAAGKICKNY